MTLSKQDLKQLASRGISEKQVEKQLKQIAEGFPFLRLEAAASVGNGIVAPSNEERDAFIQQWKQYKERPHKIVKFVPASGAASRMFKNMFAFLSSPYEVPTTDFEKTFFAEIEHFAFKDALNEACKANQGKDIVDLIAEGRHDHLALFKAKVKEKADHLAKKFGVSYNISFSEQKPSTDTIAANTDNTPFRNVDQSMLFRPGGHGALIENLNEIDADIVFIKNIDNVVPDRLKPSTVTYKQLLAGILVDIQQKIFNYLALLDTGKYSHEELEEIKRFVQNDLCCRKTSIDKLTDAELAKYLRTKLNRPIRVCGVVKNVGEPGGGPFLTYNQDGTVSLQILESSQIDTANEEYMKMFRNGTHFNPVDLVCAIKDYLGHAFHLPDYIDHSTGFISIKSKDGRELKALELPGLWNGAMSDWNTIFVEVPLETFNPVKTVNDLLREQHQ